MVTLTLKRADVCRDCGRMLAQGSKARWYPKLGTFCADKADCAQVAREVRERRSADALPHYLATRCTQCGATASIYTDGMRLCTYCAERPPMFALPESVQRRADEFAEGVARAAAMLRAVLTAMPIAILAGIVGGLS